MINLDREYRMSQIVDRVRSVIACSLDFFFVYSYSHTALPDYGTLLIQFSRPLSARRHIASSPLPSLSQKNVMRTNKITKERNSDQIQDK